MVNDKIDVFIELKCQFLMAHINLSNINTDTIPTLGGLAGIIYSALS